MRVLNYSQRLIDLKTEGIIYNDINITLGGIWTNGAYGIHDMICPKILSYA